MSTVIGSDGLPHCPACQAAPEQLCAQHRIQVRESLAEHDTSHRYWRWSTRWQRRLPHSSDDEETNW
jgi:hypothetical protein